MSRQVLLIVEDHATTRNALKKIFIMKGWEVRVATTVAEGLAQLELPLHCVILDLMLPDGSGELVLKKIRDDRLPVRVAVCTGTHDQDRLGVVEGLGPDALLKKPVGLDEICRACGMV